MIDYQTTMFTIAKLIAKGVTQSLTGNWVVEQYQKMMEEVHNKVFTRMD